MYQLDDLLHELREALSTNDMHAMQEAMRRALSHKPLTSATDGTRMLHTEPGLTLLHTIANPGFVSPTHDHRTWAVIGVYGGQEDNTFYRFVDGTRRIEEAGGRSLTDGEVMTLGNNVIHKIANPRMNKLIALHVYGKNILEIERSAWDAKTGLEHPFELRIDERGIVRP